MCCGQVSRPRKQLLIGALRRVGRGLLDEVTLHPVDMRVRRDPVIAAEQPGQAGVADRDVEVVGIIVGDRLPVERSRPQRDLAGRLQRLETVGRDLVLELRHHLGDGRKVAWLPSPFRPELVEGVPFLAAG